MGLKRSFNNSYGYGGKCQKEYNKKADTTRLEFITVMLSIKALLDSNNIDKAKELIDEVIAEARRKGSDN